jgi:hypothetical protein
MPTAWGPYSDTVLHFPEAALDLDLRVALPPAAPRQLAKLGLHGPFAVITACNPLGIELDAAANQRLAAVLTSLVRERYPGAVAVQGGSPDGRHQEPGWAIAAPLDQLRRLARAFLQNALFWFDETRFVIVPVLAPGQTLPLPAPRAQR